MWNVEKRRVLIVARHYWPDAGAATERWRAVVRHYRSHGAEVLVATRKKLEDAPVAGPDGERLVGFHPDDADSAFLKRAGDLAVGSAQLLASQEIVRFAPDLVLSDPPGSLAGSAQRIAKRTDATFVYYFADDWSEHLAGKQKRLTEAAAGVVKKIDDSVISAAHGVIVVNKNHLGRMQGVARDVALIPNGLNRETYYKGGSFTELDMPQGINLSYSELTKLPLFLYAGNYGAAHGAEVLAESAVELWEQGERFRLLYVGYGSAKSHIREIAKDWPSLCLMVDPQPPTVIQRLYQYAIAGMASVSAERAHEDLVPVKALASIMCGCPVIFAGTGAFSKQIEEARYGNAVSPGRRDIQQVMLGRLRSPWNDEERKSLSERASAQYDNSRLASEVAFFVENLD